MKPNFPVSPPRMIDALIGEDLRDVLEWCRRSSFRPLIVLEKSDRPAELQANDCSLPRETSINCNDF